MDRPITIAVAGCGSRGQDTYSKILVNMPEKAKSSLLLTSIRKSWPVCAV